MKRKGLFLFLVVIAALKDSIFCCENNVPKLNAIDLRGSDVTSDYWDGGDDIVINDAYLVPGWYTVVLNNWQYLMMDVSSKPDYFACSTYWPIYLKESHPAISDIKEAPQDLVACIRDDIYPCSTTYNVQVRQCNDEIQYKLTSTSWYSAFCFEKHSYLDRPTPAPAPENVDFGMISVIPKLEFTQAEINNLTFKIPNLVFECNFSNQSGLFYTVNWYVDETPFNETFGPSNTREDLVLHEKTLLRLNISLGVNIRCGVRASVAVNGSLTSAQMSAKFYAGIKIPKSNIFLEKGNTAVVHMQSTVPIGCRYIGKQKSTCKANLKMFVNDNSPFQCEVGTVLQRPKSVQNQLCAMFIPIMTEGETWDPSFNFNFTIVTSDINYEDKDKFILKLQFDEALGHNIWRDYFFQDVTVFVQNMESYKNKICKSRNDPHMTTADGYRYEHHVEGIYMLYINMKYKIEVQQIIKKCGSGYAKCTCAIAISAGKDVFMINRCGKVNYMAFPQCGDGGILDVKEINQFNYMVFTPIGTRISINMMSWTKFFNVDIIMAPKDIGNVYGLCGKFDGNKNNDLSHRNTGEVSPPGKGHFNHHVKFTNSWRINENAEENLFRPTHRALNSWVQHNGLYCVCNSDTRVNKALCSPTQYLNCTKPGSITQRKCHIRGRGKRGVGNTSSKEMQRILSKITVHFDNRKKREDIEELVITEESRAICRNKISGIQAFTEFSDVGSNDDEEDILRQCEFDLSAVNDTSWADVHVEVVNDAVKNMLDLQPTIVENDSEKVETFFLNTCPMNCSNKGQCVDPGICSCFTFYKGPDCSIDERDALTIQDIEGGGECDLADGEECECFYVRSENIQENFTCSVNTSKILINGDVVFVSSDSLTGGFEDIFTGICCAPESITGTNEVFVAQYTVSISNNGLNFGGAENVYVFDSKCQNLTTTESGTKLFSLKEGHCFIEGYCYSENEMASSGCRSCQSSKALYNWIAFNPCKNGGNCTDDTVGYICSCIPGYGGINCEYDINECSSSPCKNGGLCIDLLNGYRCECSDGFTGKECQIDIDDCSSNPCENGASCIDGINMYQCNCAAGFEGQLCEQDINDCKPNQCQNGATCIDLIANFTCECEEGYNGRTCNNDVNECSSNPCKNGGNCTNLVNEYKCVCADGFTGYNCEREIDECTSESCQNGGTCTTGINSYTCTCSPGYTGQNCENDIVECQSDPCKNGGTCQDLINGYNCLCISGYAGPNCDTDIDDCLSDPCKNGSTCLDKVNKYECTCVPGFNGTNCDIDINECQGNPCENHGKCTDMVNGFECTCAQGYEGALCENDINECSSSPCRNGGTCLDKVNRYECVCVNGFNGTNCDNDLNECQSDPCQNGGSCKDLVNSFECTCLQGYSGLLCDNDIDECSSSPCKNGGTCLDKVNEYKCTCVPGFNGTDCENDINECQSNPCRNGGSCKDLVNSVECSCPIGYNGSFCEKDVNECQSNPCHNGGTCKDLVNGFQCTCLQGYSGTLCDNDIDECSSSPCKNGGTCLDKVNEYECTCVPGFNGTNCDNEIDECTNNPCTNGGTCKDLVNGFECTCVPGYNGKYCDDDIDECSSNPCQNGGTCTDKVNEFECLCFPGFVGPICEIEISVCSSNPCRNGGTCRDLVNGEECSCAPGYVGDFCENDFDECSSNPCKNGGTCTDKVNEYKCSCVFGFNGTNCDNVLQTTTSTVLPNFVKMPVTIVFQVQFSVNDNDPTLRKDVAFQLTKVYKSSMGDNFKEIAIVDLRFGSLIVDYEVSYLNESSAVAGLTNANLDLVSGETTIEVLNETVKTVSVTIANVTVSNVTLGDVENLCGFYKLLNGDCEDHLTCSLVKGRPTCVGSDSKQDTADDVTLIVVIAVCSVVVIAMVTTSICIFLRIRRKGKRLRKTRGNYDPRQINTHKKKKEDYNESSFTTFTKGSFKSISDFQEFTNHGLSNEQID